MRDLVVSFLYLTLTRVRIDRKTIIKFSLFHHGDLFVVSVRSDVHSLDKNTERRSARITVKNWHSKPQMPRKLKENSGKFDLSQSQFLFPLIRSHFFSRLLLMDGLNATMAEKLPFSKKPGATFFRVRFVVSVSDFPSVKPCGVVIVRRSMPSRCGRTRRLSARGAISSDMLCGTF